MPEGKALATCQASQLCRSTLTVCRQLHNPSDIPGSVNQGTLGILVLNLTLQEPIRHTGLARQHTVMLKQHVSYQCTPPNTRSHDSMQQLQPDSASTAGTCQLDVQPLSLNSACVSAA